MTDQWDPDGIRSVQDRLLEINEKVLDRATNYSALIIGSGYVVYLTIIGVLHEYMHPKAVVLSAALVLISSLFFCVWEVVKMTNMAFSSQPIASFLHLPPAEFHKAVDLADKVARRRNARLLFWWPWFLCATVLSGFIGGLIAIGSFILRFFS